MKTSKKEKSVTFLLAVLPLVMYLAISFAVTIVGTIVICIVYMLINNTTDTYLIMEYVLSQTMLLTMISNAFVLVACIPILLLSKNNYLPKLSAQPGKFYKFTAMSFAMCMVVIVSLAASLIFSLFPINDSAYETVEAAIVSANIVVQLLSTVVFAPICEEIICRRMIMNKLLGAFSMKVAVVISAVIFAVLHGNLTQGVFAFLLGIIIGYLYLKTKSLLMCILLHAINNLMAVIEMHVSINPMIIEAIVFAVFLVPAVMFLKNCRKIRIVTETNETDMIDENVTEEV